jgi:hypothetical protein
VVAIGMINSHDKEHASGVYWASVQPARPARAQVGQDMSKGESLAQLALLDYMDAPAGRCIHSTILTQQRGGVP